MSESLAYWFDEEQSYKIKTDRIKLRSYVYIQPYNHGSLSEWFDKVYLNELKLIGRYDLGWQNQECDMFDRGEVDGLLLWWNYFGLQLYCRRIGGMRCGRYQRWYRYFFL